jgi:surface protein
VPSPAPTHSPTDVPTEVPSPAPIPATSAPIPAPICATEGQDCDTTDCCGGLTCNTFGVTCVKPTPSPTDVPTETPTPEPPCSPSFDNAGLKTATYAYLRQDCQTNSTCAIIAEHGDIEEWCTSEVTNMHALFWHPEGSLAHLQAKAFNKNLSKWNVGKVTDMQFMFMEAAAFNQNLCAWGKFASFPYGYDGTYGMFLASGCTYHDYPKQEGGINGPFCASNCDGALF